MKRIIFALIVIFSLTALFACNSDDSPLRSLSVGRMPYKTEYVSGSDIDLSGLELECVYRDGATQTVTDGYTYAPVSASELGRQTVSVSYLGKTVSLEITVTPEITEISVASLPVRTVYMAGESFDMTGLSLNVFYSDEMTRILYSGFTVDKRELSGKDSFVTVFYEGQETSFRIEVWEPDPSVTAICPGISDRVYHVGDAVEKTETELILRYNDERPDNIILAADYTLENNIIRKSGENTVWAVYRGIRYPLTVIVSEP